jgi:uncharacterized protein (TIGR02145 family)
MRHSHNQKNKMNKTLFTACIAIAIACTTNAQVGIGIPSSQIDPSAQLQVSSTTKGLLPPTMTIAQRNAIASPAEGLMIYCTDCGGSGQPQFYNGSSWCNMLGGIGIDQTSHTCGGPLTHNPNLTYGTMTDQQGSVYKTIVIGTQEWMAENLNTSIYRNGDAIPTNVDWETWASNPSGAWAYYNNEESYACPYGKLYNWYTCVDARQLCPTGWHVPTDAEWTVLTNYLGGAAVAGGKMKTTGTIGAQTGLWYSPNTDATNSSGFSGAPGGLRDNITNDEFFGGVGGWWSSSEYDTDWAWYRSVCSSNGSLCTLVLPESRHYKQVGFSVRCLRN